MPSHLPLSRAKPAIVSVSRYEQGFFAQMWPPSDIGAVGDLRHDAIITDVAGAVVDSRAIDHEAVVELDIGAAEQLLQGGLAGGARELP
jgi:hypothetical protein